MKCVTGAAIAVIGLAAPAAAFEITSADIKDGGRLKEAQVASIFGCAGGNLSPQVSWRGAPQGTGSFSVSLYDPDAPGGFWHWMVFDIPADVQGLATGAGSAGGSLPSGAIAARGDGGTEAYVGACPPPGPPHRYVLTVRALKAAKLGLDAAARSATAAAMSDAGKLAEATITAAFGR